jgi:cell division protein FtsL|tara:strand:+ start:32 stop:301 length:270 start_codon:yes stop_codon:yes gene_type:complete
MRIMINLIILSFITISAFTVIYVKHKNRLINIDIERSEKKLSNELNEHKRLLDIKAQLIDKKLTDSNIKRILGMEIPDKNKIIYIDLVE